MKRIPFSQVLKTAAIDIRREYDRLYGMFCVQKFQDMVGAGSSLKDYCATFFCSASLSRYMRIFR